ncbi:MAG: archaellin/type IV pilin N-terminal domain-containing protein [Candidatus Aenigmatarchaeota archaeon]
MKGISPLIATIILIGITVLIAGILGLWAANFVTSRTQEIGQGTTEIMRLKCNIMKFTVVSKNELNNNISFIILNDGPIDINGLSFTFIDLDDQNNIKNVAGIETNTTLKRASYSRIEVSKPPEGYDKIEIRSIECPNVKEEIEEKTSS